MKKIFKVLIALVVIVVAVVVAINIFNGGNKNIEAYNNVMALNSGIKSGDNNVALVVDNTVDEMLNIINDNNLEMPDDAEFLETYSFALNAYLDVKEIILEHGIHTNKNNTGSYVSKMNSSFNKLKKSYLKGYDYLNKTYFALNGNYEHIETVQSYITNFVYEFKLSLNYLNDFYYNATYVYAYGTTNIIETTNLDKLNVLYYVEVVHDYLNNYKETTIKNTYLSKIQQVSNTLGTNLLNNYLNNKTEIDEIYNGRNKLYLNELVSNYLNGAKDAYLASVKNEQQKLLQEKYVEYIIEG